MFKLIDRGSFDWAVNRRTQEKESVNRQSTDVHREENPMLAVNRPNSIINRELGSLRGRLSSRPHTWSSRPTVKSEQRSCPDQHYLGVFFFSLQIKDLKLIFGLIFT